MQRNFMLIAAAILGLMSGCDNGAKPDPKKTEEKVTPPPPAQPPKEPLIKKAEVADWCPEHGVPESICTRCNAKLIEGFKKKGDWCAKHELPESQCLVCHPDFKAKFEAMKPKGT